MADKYDDDIAEIMKEVEEGEDFSAVVNEHWCNASPLFQYATPLDVRRRPDGKECGCLTMIRKYPDCSAWTDKLTEEIRSDERIPFSAWTVTPEDLPVFAEWQRRLDKEIRQSVA